MTEQELQDLLQALLTSASVMLDDPDAEDEEHFIKSVQTFEEARIFTHDKGLVVTTGDGREFQITIVRTG